MSPTSARSNKKKKEALKPNDKFQSPTSFPSSSNISQASEQKAGLRKKRKITVSPVSASSNKKRKQAFKPKDVFQSPTSLPNSSKISQVSGQKASLGKRKKTAMSPTSARSKKKKEEALKPNDKFQSPTSLQSSSNISQALEQKAGLRKKRKITVSPISASSNKKRKQAFKPKDVFQAPTSLPNSSKISQVSRQMASLGKRKKTAMSPTSASSNKKKKPAFKPNDKFQSPSNLPSSSNILKSSEQKAGLGKKRKIAVSPISASSTKKSNQTFEPKDANPGPSSSRPEPEYEDVIPWEIICNPSLTHINGEKPVYKIFSEDEIAEMDESNRNAKTMRTFERPPRMSIKEFCEKRFFELDKEEPSELFQLYTPDGKRKSKYTKRLIEMREELLKEKAKSEENSKKEPIRKKKVKKVRDDNKPKRPASSYFLFLGDKRNQIKRDNPGIEMKEITKKAAEMWKQVTDKSKWEEKAAKLKKEYEDAMYEYRASGGGAFKSRLA